MDSQVAEGFLVCRRVPFPERGEWILERRVAAELARGRLGQENMSVGDGISDFVASADAECGADSLRNRRLSLLVSMLVIMQASQASSVWRGKTLPSSGQVA